MYFYGHEFDQNGEGENAGLFDAVITWAFDLDSDEFARATNRGLFTFVHLPQSVNGRGDLASINDSKQYTFVDIADIIEEQL